MTESIPADIRQFVLRYIDSIGVAEFVALADKYADLGPLYHPTAKLREMAAKGQSFYG